MNSRVSNRDVGLAKFAIDVDCDVRFNAAPFNGKDAFFVNLGAGADAATAEDATVGIVDDIGMRCVDIFFRPKEGEADVTHAEAIRERLQFTITTLFAIGALMVALGENQLEVHAAQAYDFGGIRMHHHIVGRGCRAGGIEILATGTFNLNHAHAARAGVGEKRMVTERGNIDVGAFGSLKNGVTFIGRDANAINRKEDCFHSAPSMAGQIIMRLARQGEGGAVAVEAVPRFLHDLIAAEATLDFVEITHTFFDGEDVLFEFFTRFDIVVFVVGRGGYEGRTRLPKDPVTSEVAINSGGHALAITNRVSHHRRTSGIVTGGEDTGDVGHARAFVHEERAIFRVNQNVFLNFRKVGFGLLAQGWYHQVHGNFKLRTLNNGGFAAASIVVRAKAHTRTLEGHDVAINADGLKRGNEEGKLHALVDGFFDFFLESRHVVFEATIEHLNRFSPKPECRAGGIHRSIATANNYHALAFDHYRITDVKVTEEIHATDDTGQMFTLDAEFVTDVGTDSQADRFVTEFEELIKSDVFTDFYAVHDTDPHVGNHFDLLINHLTWQAVGRDAEAQCATWIRQGLEHDHFIAFLRKEVGDSKAGRTCANDGNLVLGWLDAFDGQFFFVEGDIALDGADIDGTISLATAALQHARMVADSAANSRQRVAFAMQHEGIEEAPFGSELYVPRRVNVTRTCIFARCGEERRTDAGTAAFINDVLLVFFAEIAQGGQDGVGRGLAEAAKTHALHHGAQLDQAVKVFKLALPFRDAVKDIVQLFGTHAARRAFTARFADAKLHEEFGDIDHAGVLIHDDEATGTHHGADFLEGFVLHGNIEELLWNAATGGTASLSSFKLLAVGNATADVEDDLTQRGAHGDLDNTRVAHATGQGENFGAFAALSADGGEPLTAVANDGRDTGEGLHIVNERGHAPETFDGRERWLRRGLTALTFDRMEQGCLFTADEGPGADAQLDIEIEGGAENIFAEEAVLACRGDALFNHFNGERILRAAIDNAVFRADRVAGDCHGFEHAMGIAFEHVAIHKGARVAFVGVAHDVFAFALSTGDELPFDPRGEAATAATAETADFDLLDYLLRRHFGERFSKSGVTVTANVLFDVGGINDSRVFHDDAQVLPLEEVGLAHVIDDILGVEGVINEATDRPAFEEVLFNNFRDIPRLDLDVHDVVGIDDHDGRLFAVADTVRRQDTDFVIKAELAETCAQRGFHCEGAFFLAHGASTNQDTQACSWHRICEKLGSEQVNRATAMGLSFFGSITDIAGDDNAV